MFETTEARASIPWGEEFLNTLTFIDTYKGKITHQMEDSG